MTNETTAKSNDWKRKATYTYQNTYTIKLPINDNLTTGVKRKKLDDTSVSTTIPITTPTIVSSITSTATLADENSSNRIPLFIKVKESDINNNSELNAEEPIDNKDVIANQQLPNCLAVSTKFINRDDLISMRTRGKLIDRIASDDLMVAVSPAIPSETGASTVPANIANFAINAESELLVEPVNPAEPALSSVIATEHQRKAPAACPRKRATMKSCNALSTSTAPITLTDSTTSTSFIAPNTHTRNRRTKSSGKMPARSRSRKETNASNTSQLPEENTSDPGSTALSMAMVKEQLDMNASTDLMEENTTDERFMKEEICYMDHLIMTSMNNIRKLTAQVRESLILSITRSKNITMDEMQRFTQLLRLYARSTMTALTEHNEDKATYGPITHPLYSEHLSQQNMLVNRGEEEQMATTSNHLENVDYSQTTTKAVVRKTHSQALRVLSGLIAPHEDAQTPQGSPAADVAANNFNPD